MGNKTVLLSSSPETFEIDLSNHTWVFSEHFTYTDPDGNAIDQTSIASHDNFIIDGNVSALTPHMDGVLLEGSYTTLTVGATGSIVADTGILASGDHLTIRNDGLIIGEGFAAAILADGTHTHIANNGTLQGEDGILAETKNVVVHNNGAIYGVFSGIILDSDGAKAVLGKDSMITAGHLWH